MENNENISVHSLNIQFLLDNSEIKLIFDYDNKGHIY